MIKKSFSVEAELLTNKSFIIVYFEFLLYYNNNNHRSLTLCRIRRDASRQFKLFSPLSVTAICTVLITSCFVIYLLHKPFTKSQLGFHLFIFVFDASCSTRFFFRLILSICHSFFSLSHQWFSRY